MTTVILCPRESCRLAFGVLMWFISVPKGVYFRGENMSLSRNLGCFRCSEAALGFSEFLLLQV